jgi:hypothetical protein
VYGEKEAVTRAGPPSSDEVAAQDAEEAGGKCRSDRAERRYERFECELLDIHGSP